MMKKVITVLISLLMILSLVACGNSASQTGQPSTKEITVDSTVENDEHAGKSIDVEIGTEAEDTEASEDQLRVSEAPEGADTSEGHTDKRGKT